MIDLLRHGDIDVFFMTEIWHSIGSFALDRLRAAAFTVIDCLRPRDPNDAPSALLCVNHDGVAVLDAPGLGLRRHVIGITITSFEFISARLQLTGGHLTSLVVVVTRS